MSDQPQSQRRETVVRSYAGITDKVERKIYKIDRFRLPNPGGVSVRALVYAGATLVGLLFLAQLPLLDLALAALPPSVTYLALPALGGWALSSWQIDGRAPHHALLGLLRYRFSARTLSGLAPCPISGTRVAPVDEVEIAPSGDDSHYRSGRVKGPAVVTLRYPARITPEGVPRSAHGASPQERARVAKRLRVSAVEGSVRPMPVGQRFRIPAGKEVIFE